MSENTDFLIKLHLSAVVPLMIADLSQQGGITDYHLERVKGHAVYLGEHGDAILYRVPGQTGKAMNVLCECLAVLAFAPGGVKFAGLHFEGHPTFEADPTKLESLLWLDALPPVVEPEPEQEMTWEEIFRDDRVGADAVKLGVPPKLAKKLRM